MKKSLGGHTTQEIIDNQEKYKENIINWFKEYQKELRERLNNIKTDDEFIMKKKRKMENTYKKMNFSKYVKNFFFLTSSKDAKYYAWWDDNEEEVKFFKYKKRKRKRIRKNVK